MKVFLLCFYVLKMEGFCKRSVNFLGILITFNFGVLNDNLADNNCHPIIADRGE